MCQGQEDSSVAYGSTAIYTAVKLGQRYVETGYGAHGSLRKKQGWLVETAAQTSDEPNHKDASAQGFCALTTSCCPSSCCKIEHHLTMTLTLP